MGVTLTDDDAVPAPAAFTAFNWTEYVVPFVKPVIVIGLVVSEGLNAVNVDPPFVEYS
jgi:hypothetical protein